jgi:hypothetical protein
MRAKRFFGAIGAVFESAEKTSSGRDKVEDKVGKERLFQTRVPLRFAIAGGSAPH